MEIKINSNSVRVYYDMKEKEMSSEEILKLPKDEFIKYMENVRIKQYQNLSDIGGPNYSKFSLKEKIHFWSENLNRQMRMLVESGYDEYIIFNDLWYNSIKKIEPNLDLIMEKVFEKFKLYGWDWSQEEYFYRISKKP